MIRIEKWDHIGIRVKSFERSVPFYALFGFKVRHTSHDENLVIMTHPKGMEINLLDTATVDTKGTNILLDSHENSPGYTHVSFKIDSVDEAVKALKKHDIKITEGPVQFTKGATAMFVGDPDGNVIELTHLENEEQ